MVRLDERVVRAMGMLKSHPEFKPLVDYLKARCDAHKETLVAATDTAMIHRYQGRAAELQNLLDGIANSDELLRKIVKQ